MRYHKFLISVDLIPDNLGKVQDLIIHAQTKWINLGLGLHIKMSRLEVIEQNCHDVGSRFRKMLHTWLKMVEPSPSWEGLIVALEKESVGCDDVADGVRQMLGIPQPTCDSASTSAGAVSITAGQFHPLPIPLPPPPLNY